MVQKETDKLFRNITKDYLEVVFEKFGINDKIVRIHPTSGLSIDNRGLEMDFVYENQDGIIKDAEFQITIVDVNDQYRFLKYNIYMNEYYGEPCEVFVLSAVEKAKVKKLKLSQDNTIKLKIFSIIDVDGDEKLNSIKVKVENNLKLNLSEYIDLVFMGYYSCKNKEKNIETAIKILTSVYDENENMEKLISYQYLMYNKFIKIYKNLERIKGLFEMRLPALEQSLREREEIGIEIGEKRGEKRGKAQGKFDVALNMVHKMDMSVEEAAEIAEVPLNQLKEAVGY